MTDVEYNAKKMHMLEDISKNHFGVKLHVKKLIANDIVTNHDTSATLFVDTTDNLYLIIESAEAMTLADVRSMVKSMNLSAKGYFAPHRDANYFENSGREIYSKIFPGLKTLPKNTKFYQTLSKYSPALVLVDHLKGDLRSFNVIGNRWQTEYDIESITARIAANE